MAVRDDTVTSLDELARIQEDSDKLEQQRLRAVASARRAGATWEDIGRALRLARQSAWERYAPLIEALEASWISATLSEDEARALARDALREVRKNRRAHTTAAR